MTLVATVAFPPVRTFFKDVAHPPQSLDIVDQGRLAEQADLERERRFVPWQAPLAFQALKKRRFLTANVSASSSAQMHHGAARRQFRNLGFEYFTRSGVFVAQINVDV